MDKAKAKKDAEALRYRLQVRLGMIAQVATERGDAPASIEVTRLRKAVDVVDVREDELTTGAAKTALAALEPEITTLQTRLGIDRFAPPLMPKWARFVAFASPVVVFLLTLVVWIQLRRRKKAVEEAQLKALDDHRE